MFNTNKKICKLYSLQLEIRNTNHSLLKTSGDRMNKRLYITEINTRGYSNEVTQRTKLATFRNLQRIVSL